MFKLMNKTFCYPKNVQVYNTYDQSTSVSQFSDIQDKCGKESGDLTDLATREDAQADGTLRVQETPDELPVMRLFHSLHHILQGVIDFWFLKQRQGELTAPPAGQVV